MKQTAVEWFAERIQSDKIFNFENLLNKAKEMDKVQHKETAEYWNNRGILSTMNYDFERDNFEQWYQKKYGGNK